MFHRVRANTIWLFAIFAFAIALAPAASAKTSTAATHTARADRHCVVNISPLQAGAAASAVSVPTCYPTFAEALAAATNGAVQLPAGATSADVTQATLAPAVATSTTIIGIDWININYSGSSLTWEVSNSVGCSTGLSYQSNVTGSWNNVISSSKAFSGCNINTHWDLPFPNNQNGAFINCLPNCASMGAMNDATSAETWKP